MENSEFEGLLSELGNLVEEALKEWGFTEVEQQPRPFNALFDLSQPLTATPLEEWHMEYGLDGHGNPVPFPDTHEGRLAAYRLLMNGKKRLVTCTHWKHRGHHLVVSTIFTVFNCDVSGLPGYAPVLWETMVFTRIACLAGFQRRYTSKFDALKGHKAIVEGVKAHLRLHRQPPSPRRRRVAVRRIAQGQSLLRRRGKP